MLKWCWLPLRVGRGTWFVGTRYDQFSEPIFNVYRQNILNRGFFNLLGFGIYLFFEIWLWSDVLYLPGLLHLVIYLLTYLHINTIYVFFSLKRYRLVQRQCCSQTLEGSVSTWPSSTRRRFVFFQYGGTQQAHIVSVYLYTVAYHLSTIMEQTEVLSFSVVASV